MPSTNGGAIRYDINDPKDMALLVQSPMFWSKSGPDTIDKAITFLQENPDAMNDAVPADIRAEVEGTAVPTPEPESPVEEAGEPGEEPPVV